VRIPKYVQKMPRVAITYDPDRPAILIKEGPEVSEIVWVDSGLHQFLNNRHIKKTD